MHAGLRCCAVFTVAAILSPPFMLSVEAQSHPGLVTLSVGSGSSPTEMEEVGALIDRMTSDGQLVLQARHSDRQLPARQHEGFSQYFSGVPVHGASISRQTEAGTTISIFGTVYTDIDIDPSPSLSLGDASTLIAQGFGVTALEVLQPLTILPTLDGDYALAYRMTASNLVTYFVDAHGGQVLMEIDERREQSAVGRGLGVLGDLKKVSATGAGGVFVALDQLRPAEILTLNVGGSRARLQRLQRGDLFASDVATDADNNWTNRGIVDTHVHMGWTHDYFFKRHSWAGLDGRNAAVYGARASSAIQPNNAFFAPPPFGPNGGGIAVFGTTPAGTPLTTLDIVAHELMHGVTEFGVRRRNSRGLESLLHFDGLGPTSVVLDGRSISCSNLVAVFSDGRRLPFLCDDDGRFVLASNHGGAAHEAFSDVFGTSAEFLFQTPGAGPLRADYLMGEDIPELGSRSLRSPSSRFVDTTRTVGHPDYYSRRLRFAVVVLGPQSFDVVNLAFNGSRFIELTGNNFGGVHWNSGILGHAFYLAIEGGRNNTSGIRVDGVGGANRGQIERVFFRAVTELIPGIISLPVVANVVCQAAVDLFGHDSFAAMAVDQALYAVGLRPQPVIEWCRAR